jgi:hypothetical protein
MLLGLEDKVTYEVLTYMEANQSHTQTIYLHCSVQTKIQPILKALLW